MCPCWQYQRAEDKVLEKMGKSCSWYRSQHTPMAEIFFRSSRLVGREAMVPPLKPATTILPSQARLRGKRGRKRNFQSNVHSHSLGRQLFKKKEEKKIARAGKAVKTSEPSRTIGRIAKWCACHGERCGGFSKY